MRVRGRTRMLTRPGEATTSTSTSGSSHTLSSCAAASTTHSVLAQLEAYR